MLHNKEDILKNYLDLADKLYDLLLDENKRLRNAQELTPDFLENKQTLLDDFSNATDSLKIINNAPKIEGIHSNELIKASQKKTMKILLLERENEQLLHKTHFNQQSQFTTLAPSKRSALAAYANNSSKNG